jgi:immune inhibitor A
LLGLSLAATSSFVLSGSALAQPTAKAPAPPSAADSAPFSDELPNPVEEERRELRDVALKEVMSGRAKPVDRDGSKVVKLGRKNQSTATTRATATGDKDAYVELAREKTDNILVVLAEFGDERHPDFPDKDMNPAIPGPARFDGPLHNEIPEPDRTVDNSTNWRADYSADYFRDLYFGTGSGDESLKQYYERQSSGRYSVNGQVTDWVKVQYNEARYGRSNDVPTDANGDDPNVCSGNVCSTTHYLIQDAANEWYNSLVAAGQTPEQIKASLADYDKWDRYDYDGDGNFNEADGYIDHFQIVHSGGDQADGDPWQAEDAIWSHRWGAFFNPRVGPDGYGKVGGTQLGDTGLWIYDYTIQPENGGRSVFYHEYAHDLGLPDDYDTTGGGDNANEYWTLMAQSRLGAKGEQSIGNRGGDLGAWNKLQLGWLDYEVIPAGVSRTLWLGPEEYNSDKPQGVVMPLPKKAVPSAVGAPYAGNNQWYSGTGNNKVNSMSRSLTLPAAAATLTFQARWDIEDCGPTIADACDYAFVEVDDGTGFKTIPGTITKPAENNGIDGTQATWAPASFDLSAFAGKTITLRFRYVMDPNTEGNVANVTNGIFFDEIAITAGGQTVFADGAESGTNGWTLNGFVNTTATLITLYDNYYIAGWRTYVSYDRYLKTGPYYFTKTGGDWVDHFSYQRGLLISYWDTSQGNNNVSQHPGQGRNLYVDARPTTLYRLDGLPWRTRIQIYDAPFSLWKADSFTLRHEGQPMYIRGPAGQPLFDDTQDYFDENLPNHGVKLPAVGVKIRVLEQDGTSVKIRIS